MTEIRVTIAGVGNCASAPVQGIQLHRRLPDAEDWPGVMHPVLANHRVSDVTFVAAFDVNRPKIGRGMAWSIFTPANVCTRFSGTPPLGLSVRAGPVLDGAGSRLKEPFSVYSERGGNLQMLLMFQKPVTPTCSSNTYLLAVLQRQVLCRSILPQMVADGVAKR